MKQRRLLILLSLLLYLGGPINCAENVEEGEDVDWNTDETDDVVDDDAITDEEEANLNEWDNVDEDEQKMKMDGESDSLFPVLFLSQEIASGHSDAVKYEGVLRFVHTHAQHFPTFSARDVGIDKPVLKFFKSTDDLKLFTLSEAFHNGKLPEKEAEQVKGMNLPDREKLQNLAVESIVIEPEDTHQSIIDHLVDHGVRRVEKVGDDGEESDFQFDEEDDDAPPETGPDGEIKPKRKKKVNWRKRREERLKREKKEGQKRQDDFQPAYKLTRGMGLGVPGWLLSVIAAVIAGGASYLGWLLHETHQENKRKEDEKLQKISSKAQKKLRRSNSKKRS